MRLVQGVVVGAVRLRDVLTRDRGQQGLELILAGLVPADAQPPHRQGLDVERLVSERVRQPVHDIVVADVRPVEGGVVTDEHGPPVVAAHPRPDELAERPHRLIGRGSLGLQVLAGNAVHRHRLAVETAADRLQLDIEALVLGSPDPFVPADRHDPDRHQVVEPRDRSRRLHVDAEIDEISHQGLNPGGGSAVSIGRARPLSGSTAARTIAPSATSNRTATLVEPRGPGGRSATRTHPRE